MRCFITMLALLGVITLASSCTPPEPTRSDHHAGNPKALNLLPMYGRLPKPPELVATDSEFVAGVRQQFATRAEASAYFASRGWDYYQQAILDTAMFRFNQAWLLDSTSAQAYWGFGNIVGRQGRPDEAVPLFETALRLEPANARLLVDAATAYRERYRLTNDGADASRSFGLLHRALELDPELALAHHHLAVWYYYLRDYEAAWAAEHRVAELDRSVVVPDFIEALKRELPDPRGVF